MCSYLIAMGFMHIEGIDAKVSGGVAVNAWNMITCGSCVNVYAAES